MAYTDKVKTGVKHILHFIFKNVFLLGDRIPLRIQDGHAKGGKIGIDIRDNYQYYSGKYDSWFLNNLDFSKYIKKGAICWDCGSYIGYYTAIFRNYAGISGEVHTFEASPKNFKIVQQLSELNSWKNVYYYNNA